MASTSSQAHPVEFVRVPHGNVEILGDLIVPPSPKGVVLFAHGSGSSRFSRRNRFVAEHLQDGGLATLLIDLLTHEEEVIDDRTAELRFDIELLAERLVSATDWLIAHPSTLNQPVGIFGASTGGGAALVAAARRPNAIGAVVSRGGRPDLAGAETLRSVTVPTLLIVGGDDPIVIRLNRQAMQHLQCKRQMTLIPGATHLFEEPGALERVADLARQWFLTHLKPGNGGMMLCP